MNQVTQKRRAATWGAAVSAAISVLLATSLHAAPASRFVECETFTDYGGWVVDPHSMKRMGSSYLMAHGYGKPVKDATRIVNFAEAGRYTVWARTRDWSTEWRKGRGTPPGRFQVLVNGRPVGDAVLGTNGGTWAWQRAGEVDLPVGDATVALHDLTGFNARCDVVYFSKDPDDVPPNDARELEAGQYRDMADDTEAIRDYGLLSIFSNWSFLKNRSARKAEFANDRIEWVSPIGGKRESYRVVGDHVLTQNDIEDHVAYPDLTAAVTWNIDLHFPDPENEAKFEEPFRSCAYHRHYGRPYAVPYRCLYARDCANLFLAGRHVSCSHVAFAAVRVMRTLGMLGEVAGMAASICKKRGCLPRDVYADHLDELKGLMRKGVPKLGVYHSGGCSGDNEFYHFKDTGHFPIWPKPRPMTPRVRDAIEKIGLRHRHEPEKKD